MKLKAITRSGFLTNTEEARNTGSLRNRNPRSTPPCSLYVEITCSCERRCTSRMLVATIKAAFFLPRAVTSAPSPARSALRSQTVSPAPAPLSLLHVSLAVGEGFRPMPLSPYLGAMGVLHIRLIFSATVKDGDALLVLFWQLLTQLGHHLFHRSTQMLLIGAIAIQRSQKERHISIMGGGKRQHPLLKILAVVA